MKKNILLIGMVVLLAIAGTNLMSCKPDPDPEPDPVINELLKKQLENLSGGWKQSTVTQNGTEPQFEITTSPVISFTVDLDAGTNNTYSVTDGHYALPTGTAAFTFVEGTSYAGVTLDGYVVTINSVNASTLVLQRVATEELTSGRTASIGTYVMTFSKQ